MNFFIIVIFLGFISALNGSEATAKSVADIVTQSNFEDVFIGSTTAPVTLIIYSSPTCGHCIDFHDTELPKLQEKYVATGKLKISYRPFVRNPVDSVIYLLAKSQGSEKFEHTVSYFMDRFNEINEADNIEKALRQIAEGLGIDRVAFDHAISDQAYLDQINAQTQEALQKFDVLGTPSFFVNGKKIEIKKNFDEIADAVERAAK